MFLFFFFFLAVAFAADIHSSSSSSFSPSSPSHVFGAPTDESHSRLRWRAVLPVAMMYVVETDESISCFCFPRSFLLTAREEGQGEGAAIERHTVFA